MIPPCLQSSQRGSSSVSPHLPCSKGPPWLSAQVMSWPTTSQDGISCGQLMEGGSRPEYKLGLAKRDHFHEVQGKLNPLSMGESRKGLWRNGKGEGGTLRGSSGRLEGRRYHKVCLIPGMASGKDALTAQLSSSQLCLSAKQPSLLPQNTWEGWSRPTPPPSSMLQGAYFKPC